MPTRTAARCTHRGKRRARLDRDSASPLVFFFGAKAGKSTPEHIELLKQLPGGCGVNAVPGEQNTYSGDYTKTVCLVGHTSAVGTVKLMDLSPRLSTASATRARRS